MSIRRPAHHRTYVARMTLHESTARTRELGAELRRIREAAHYTGHALALKLGWSPSRVSRIETGDRRASEVDAAIYAAFCGATGEDLDRVLDLTQYTHDKHWLHIRGEQLSDELQSLIALESTAETLVYYEPVVIPGLIQTEDYARALVLETELVPTDAIGSVVRIRMERQRLLRRLNPPNVTFYIHENALRMPVGGRRIMHEQILHLLLTCTTPPCRVRVVPTRVGARAGALGPFTWAAHHEHNPVIYVEHLTTSLFLEGLYDKLAYRHKLDRLSKLALDAGQSREFLADLASEYEREVGEHDPPARSGPDLA